MKKLISTLSFIFFIGIVAVSAQCCSGATPDKPCDNKAATTQAKKSSEVKAYYFHATRRCETCQAVESVTKAALTEYYGGKVSFESINREEEKDNPMIAKHKISGQTLLIIKGNRVINLTNDAFLNARNNPDKFKAKLKSTIDSLM